MAQNSAQEQHNTWYWSEREKQRDSEHKKLWPNMDNTNGLMQQRNAGIQKFRTHSSMGCKTKPTQKNYTGDTGVLLRLWLYVKKRIINQRLQVLCVHWALKWSLIIYSVEGFYTRSPALSVFVYTIDIRVSKANWRPELSVGIENWTHTWCILDHVQPLESPSEEDHEGAQFYDKAW